MNDQQQQEIFPRVATIIQEALRVPREKITPDARLFLDLGAESLDLLDIRFRIENVFGFKIDQEEIVRSLGAELTAEQVQENLTAGSLEEYVRYRLSEKDESAPISDEETGPAEELPHGA
jgi:acyl carrier protein